MMNFENGKIFYMSLLIGKDRNTHESTYMEIL